MSNYSIKPETAKRILTEVCNEYIPGRFEVGFTQHDGEPMVYVASLESGSAFGWVLTEPRMTEKLLHLDAHSFCAWVIRDEGDENEADGAMVRFRVRQ